MKKLWRTLNVYTLMVCVMAATSVCMLIFFGVGAFVTACVMTLICAVIAIIENIRITKTLDKYIRWVTKGLGGERASALNDAPVPILIAGATGEIVWYNSAFRSSCAGADLLISKNLDDVVGEDAYERLLSSGTAEVTLGDSIFTACGVSAEHEGNKVTAYLFFNITDYKILKKQYKQSRPAVAIIEIDNVEEISRGVNDADTMLLKSSIHNCIQKWASETNGIFRRIYGDRYMMVVDEKDLHKLISGKFGVLGAVKEIKVGEYSPSVSIGVGRQADTYLECEGLAVQALEMAQSRGGDQAAVKAKNGEYEFFGGLSATQEKHTKARARVVSSAICELIKGSEGVIVMGHKYSDLDSIGSAYGMYRLACALGVPAYMALDETTTMAGALVSRISGMDPDFRTYTAEELMPLVTKKTLLIISDVHRACLTEYPELIGACGTTVVIDHHRRAVDYIEGAVIFYHETAASSASEMVTELLKYSGNKVVGQTEAEGLLAGIMLDSRNFVMNAGARTFEAAAFLRDKGADPISVKKLFSGSMSAYKQRANIVATAQIYGDSAIAVDTECNNDTRLVTAQAADELLGISNVTASFVLCRLADGKINISARSLGSVNVQLIMETLGGGGHRTMAACQLTGVSFEEAAEKLKLAIDTYRANISK